MDYVSLDGCDPAPQAGAADECRSHGHGRLRLVCARLLIGGVVLVCAEVFSGASLAQGLWAPWTLLMTYWLYFAHFFLFTTLAIRTGRTSFTSLYLWGVLFGLYESWITKVIWAGYQGDGNAIMGRIGPYGFSEISMVFFFHPLLSLILPLAVACLLCPPLRGLFPDLAWFTGRSRGARLAQAYLVLCFAPVMAMNSGGAVNLATNIAAAVAVLWVLALVARPVLSSTDGRSILEFRGWGFAVLCGYLLLLYTLTYFHLRAEARPSVPVQLATFLFYALAIAGLWLHRRRDPDPKAPVSVEDREKRLAIGIFAVLTALALVLTAFAKHKAVLSVIMVNFMIWTPLGMLLTLLSLVRGLRERLRSGS